MGYACTRQNYACGTRAPARWARRGHLPGMAQTVSIFPEGANGVYLTGMAQPAGWHGLTNPAALAYTSTPLYGVVNRLSFELAPIGYC